MGDIMVAPSYIYYTVYGFSTGLISVAHSGIENFFPLKPWNLRSQTDDLPLVPSHLAASGELALK